MRVLDLFAGLGGGSAAFRDRGHEVVTLDNDPRFGCDITMDILDVDPAELGYFDVIWASPPCEAFSVGSIGHHWGGGTRAYEPKTSHAVLSQELVLKAREVIQAINPRYFWIENPRGVLRKLGLLDDLDQVTVWYCRYGDTSAKPTDLWGVWPKNWTPRPPCRNKRPGTVNHCHHEPARRGAKTGTQGKKGAALRAVIPYELSLEICLACERAFEDEA